MFTLKNLPLVAAATAALTLATAVLAADNAKPNRAFSKADTNGDGKISEAEYLASVKDKTEEAKAKTAFARRDANQDGALSADEFKTAGKKGEGDKPTEKKRKKDKE